MNLAKKLSTGINICKNFVLDLLFPIQCIGCGMEGAWLCKKCFKTIKINKKKTSDKIIVTALYHKNPILQKAIHVYKYQFIKELHKPLAHLLIKKIRNYKLEIRNYLLVPVPLHKKRLKFRGFNQVELLANQVAEHFSIPVITDVLIRIKHTKAQMELSEKQRVKNIKNCFICAIPKKAKNKNILLIDDVATTGSTLGECKKVLLQAGAKNVLSLVLAKT